MKGGPSIGSHAYDITSMVQICTLTLANKNPSGLAYTGLMMPTSNHIMSILVMHLKYRYNNNSVKANGKEIP